MEGWNSPILVNTMVDDATKFISSRLEDDVWKAVLRCGIEVDKDELLRALRYDRDQWERGYEDGRMDGYKKRDAEIVRCGECKWYHPADKYCEAWGDVFIHWEGVEPIEEDGFCHWGVRREDG